MSKKRVSIMIDEADDNYITSICSQHGDRSRFYNVALKNLISLMKMKKADTSGSKKENKKNATKSKPKRAKGSTDSDSRRSTGKRGK